MNLDKWLDDWFKNPRNRLIMEALAAHDDKRPIDMEWVKTGKRKDDKK